MFRVTVIEQFGSQYVAHLGIFSTYDIAEWHIEEHASANPGHFARQYVIAQEMVDQFALPGDHWVYAGNGMFDETTTDAYYTARQREQEAR